MSAWVFSHGLNSSVHVWKIERQWDWRPHTHHTRISACWFSVPRHKKAYQCKTKCISLRRNDIENETGESTKPNGILCEAFQISADMQSINIQLGCVMFCFYIFVCLRLETITACCSLPFPLGRWADRAGVSPHTKAHSHTQKVKLTHQYVFRSQSPLHFSIPLCSAATAHYFPGSRLFLLISLLLLISTVSMPQYM